MRGNLLVRTVAPPTSNPASRAFSTRPTVQPLTTLGQSRAIRLDVALATTSITSFGIGGGAIGFNVSFTSTVVALLGVGGTRLFASRRFVTWFEAVEASTFGEGAVFG